MDPYVGTERPALAVLVRCLESSDDRIAIAAATAILERGFGRPTQSIDANISDDAGSVRYYAEVPKPCSTTQEWLAGNPVDTQRSPKTTNIAGVTVAMDDQQTH